MYHERFDNLLWKKIEKSILIQNIMIKHICIMLVIFGASFSHSQKAIDIFLGSGFENDSCSVEVSYLTKDGFKHVTLLKDTVLHSDHVLGLAKHLKFEFDNSSRIELKININDYYYSYRFDKFCKKTQVRIDYQGSGIDVLFKYKGRIQFY